MRTLKQYAAFREAVLDLAEEPTPMNALRYLRASASLAERASASAGASMSRRPSTEGPIAIGIERQQERIALRNDADAA